MRKIFNFVFVTMLTLAIMSCGNSEQKTDRVVCDSIPMTEIVPAAATDVLPATGVGVATDSVE